MPTPKGCGPRDMQSPSASSTVAIGMSLMASMLRSWRRARGADAVAPVTWLLLDIEDEVHGVRMGWGPEIVDLHRRLTRLAASVEHSTCHDVQRRGTAFRVTFETRQPMALQAALVRALEAEAVAPFVQLLVCSDRDSDAQRRVWP